MTHPAIEQRPPLTRNERRRYARLRKYRLSVPELCVWLLRVHERASFADIASELGVTVAEVREIDRSMTHRALAANRRWRPDID